MHKSLLNDQFFNSLDSSVLPVEEAETLPPGCYTDAEFYEFEKEALFNHEWLCVGRESWAKEAGDYFTTTLIGEPIIVVRNRQGDLKAMSSVCQHRAMLVAEGHGNARAFMCPYHHWTYSLDGDLLNGPAMEKTCDFSKTDIKLPTFKVEVWLGFVFINFDDQAAPLAPRLEAVAKILEPYDLANAEGSKPEEADKFPWNWKVMFENNNDGYHASRLHGGHYHDFVPSELSSFPDMPADTAGYCRLNGTTHSDASFNASQKALLPVFPNLKDADRNQMLFANIPPTLSLVLTNDMVFYLNVRANGPESHEMDTGLLVAPGAMDSPAFEDCLAANMATAQKIMAQDQHVDEMVQVGLRSRFAIRGRYSWQESAQQQLNSWLVPRYQDCWDKMKKTGMVSRPAKAAPGQCSDTSALCEKGEA
ncbi:aromatic ring-hydroxylating oxygenase subunit alpha [Paremcibacter congregatus]|uniref:(2Fe-2S)-binding protein n=1 Tax=Paremcibacter congregatus TaxID=2043170 RepID=A0A2G4YQP7_9PROT|nr:aromatic ring-hydroxylating dioxygenase subunit alpha [Paremcibacter congregatus]PHZ84600.1 (2Fe-2S)-binding protein [Paremcibacter congregatus]QDE28821.1 aromatic ring-hydroxylating dioxygenase subunit alpha [Paremcibacter congregatus]